MAQYINRNAPGAGLASLMAAKGRRGDTELVHMTRPEVKRLEATGLLSLNPRTGLPEASAVSDYFKNMATPRNLIPALIGALAAPMIGGLAKAGWSTLGEGQRSIRGAYDSRYEVPPGTKRNIQYRRAMANLPSNRELEELNIVPKGQEPLTGQGGLPDLYIEGSDNYGPNEIQVDSPIVQQVAGTPSPVPIHTRDAVRRALSRGALRDEQLIPLNLGPAKGEAWDKDYHLPEGRGGPSISTLAQADLRTQEARKAGTLSKQLRNVPGMTDARIWGPSIPKLQQRALELGYSPTAEDIVNAQSDVFKFSEPSTYLEYYKTQPGYGIPQALAAVAPSQFLDARAKAIREREKAMLAGIRSPEVYEQKDREYDTPYTLPPPSYENILARYYRGVQPGGWDRWFGPMSGKDVYPDMRAKEGGLVPLAKGGRAFEGKVEGPGHGMQDNVVMPIEGGGIAAVSPKEYVVPADVMAMLGNGNADDGSEKMDRFISKFRTTKYGRDRQPPEMDGSTALQSLVRA